MTVPPRSGSFFERAAARCLLSVAAVSLPMFVGDACPRSAKHADKGISLFDGKTLDGWELSKFGGDGKCRVEKGCLVLGAGVDLTGVRLKVADDSSSPGKLLWQAPRSSTNRPRRNGGRSHRELPRIDYEVQLDARRVDGSDFFCGLTFPVKKDCCSLIIGGWGGGVCGLSSIDGLDASENETTTYRPFENGRWYHIRLRVTSKNISAWLDGKQIVDQDLEGHKISIRSEVELSKPFGLASWQTTAALKNVRLRPIAVETPAAP